jgi:hypothetical protein
VADAVIEALSPLQTIPLIVLLPCARPVFPASGATVPPRRGVIVSVIRAGPYGVVVSSQ